MPIVHFVNWNKSVRAGPLADLRAIARLAGLSLYDGAAKALNCGGRGMCGTCRVVVEPLSALTPPTVFERMHKCTGEFRLACQAKIANDRVEVIHVTKRTGFRGKGRTPVPGPGIEAPDARKNAVPAAAH